MRYSRKARSVTELPAIDKTVRLTPVKTVLSNSSAFWLSSSVNVFSAPLRGCRSPDGILERALPEISSVKMFAPTNVPSLRTLILLVFSSSFFRSSPLNAECGNSSMLFMRMSRWLSFVAPLNAAESTVSILFELRVSVSSAGRFSKAPWPSLRNSPLSISSVRSSGSSGNVCVADNSTMSLFLNIILTVSLGKPKGISTKCWRSQ